MTAADPATEKPAAQLLSSGLRASPAIFALTLFVSALLLFAVQPMFAKLVLPKLGGAPAIWSVAMVFFQGALLLGYAYAHYLTRALPLRCAALVHFVLLGVAALSLPLGIASSFGAPPNDGIEIWLLGLFSVSIGLPFVALAATAPLLQRWFAGGDHPMAANPYVLYGASNLGSFAALLSYPLLVEPLMTLRVQAAAWSIGFGLLAVLIAVSVLSVGRSVVTHHDAAPKASPAAVVSWMALAAVPSGLTVAVTAYISTDVAAAPFLWVIPLALYLLTYVATFRERPWFAHSTVALAAPFLVVPLAASMQGGEPAFWFVTIALHLAAFFVLTLLCHGALYQRRPEPGQLTTFYLAISAGGVIGGAFAGLIAPRIFSTTAEYPVLIAAAVLAIPGALAGGVLPFLRQAAPALVAAFALVAAYFVTPLRIPLDWMIGFQAALILIATLALFYRANAARLFGLVVLSFTLAAYWFPGQNAVETARSFFGVNRVADTADGRFRLLFHGTTVHGAERLSNSDGTRVQGPPEPLTYYYRGGPISEAIEAARKNKARFDRVAAVGLGTGSLACYRRAGESWTFFEIDPEVARIARDPRRFRFLSSCAPDAGIVAGDARLTLAASPHRYDIIVLDAFSSDAIPAHLLTREALRGYISRLSPGGVIVMHISNRHLELEQLVAAVAEAEGLVAFAKTDLSANRFGEDYKSNAAVAVLARSESDLAALRVVPGWYRAHANGVTPWTDDYSNLIGALIRKNF